MVIRESKKSNSNKAAAGRQNWPRRSAPGVARPHHGLPFVKKYNERTAAQVGTIRGDYGRSSYSQTLAADLRWGQNRKSLASGKRRRPDAQLRSPRRTPDLKRDDIQG